MHVLVRVNLLRERVVVGRLLEILRECGYEDIRSILPEDVRERIGSADESVWRSELDASSCCSYVYNVSCTVGTVNTELERAAEVTPTSPSDSTKQN